MTAFSKTALAAALAAVLPTAAAAGMQCGERASVVAQLQEQFGETQRSIGFQEGRGVVEVYANDDSGSWTILLTTPEGMSCLMAAGEAWLSKVPAALDTPA